MPSCAPRAPRDAGKHLDLSSGARYDAAAAEAGRPAHDTVNEKLSIHEFIDVVGQNRARYMNHMTASLSPMAQEHRSQLCSGARCVPGSTGRWPEVVNVWELDGLEAAAACKIGRQPRHADRTEPWDEG